jgi:hypothetical protein
VGVAAGRPPGEVDVGPHGGVPDRRPRPRPHLQRQARARRQRQVPRAARPHLRGDGRVPVDVRAGGADVSLRDAVVGALRLPGDLRRGEGDLHQHRRGRRLPRRRPARGDVPPRAAGREGRARARHGSASSCAARTSSAPIPVPDAGRAAVRHRRLPRDARPGAARRPTTPATPARKAASQANGKLRGFGLSTYIEACGIAPSALAGALGARAGLFEAARCACTRPAR